MTNILYELIGKHKDATLAINNGICGFILILYTLNINIIPSILAEGVLIYAAINLLAAPYGFKHRFITPNIASPKCPFCGSYMTTTQLKCENCNNVSSLDKI
jgi:hypothetical protein